MRDAVHPYYEAVRVFWRNSQIRLHPWDPHIIVSHFVAPLKKGANNFCEVLHDARKSRQEVTRHHGLNYYCVGKFQVGSYQVGTLTYGLSREPRGIVGLCEMYGGNYPANSSLDCEVGVVHNDLKEQNPQTLNPKP